MTAAQARTTSRAKVADVSRVAKPELVVYAHGEPRLAWQTLVTGHEGARPTKLTVWTNARTGKVIGSWDRVVDGTGTGYYYPGVTIGTSLSGSTYRMSDSSRSGVSCANQAGTIYTGPDDVWGNGSGTNLETGCVDVLYSVDKEVDMLVGLARPQRRQGQRHVVPGAGRAGRRQRLLRRREDQLRPQPGQRPPAHGDRHRRPRERARRLRDHPGWVVR